jgi:hypothetical protein
VIRFLLFLVFAGALAYCGATVKLGNRTLFGHVRAIWHTEEAQDLKRGVEETAGPAVHRVERGIHAGVNAIRDDGDSHDAGSGAPAVPAPASP